MVHGIVAERLLSDNAWVYVKNKDLAELPDRRKILHKRTRPYTPKTNGKVERLAPAADDGPRVSPGAHLPLERRPPSRPATLAAPLQREPSSLSSRQPPAYGSRSGRLGARHLDGGAKKKSGPPLNGLNRPREGASAS